MLSALFACCLLQFFDSALLALSSFAQGQNIQKYASLEDAVIKSAFSERPDTILPDDMVHAVMGKFNLPFILEKLTLKSLVPTPLWGPRYDNNSDLRINFSPDGTKVVITGWTIWNSVHTGESSTRIFDALTGQMIHELPGHSFWAAFSPDGTKIVTTDWEYTGRIWDVQTGQMLNELEIPLVLNGPQVEERVIDSFQATFSPDGTRILTNRFDIARIWDAQTGQMIFELPTQGDGHFEAKFSPDGTKILTRDDNQGVVRMWDASTGQIVYELPGHFKSAKFSPDGTKIATYDDKEPTDRIVHAQAGVARLWDAQTGNELHVLYHGSNIHNIEFSLDSAYLATSTTSYDRVSSYELSLSSSVYLWDTQTGHALRVLHVPERARIYTVIFSPDNKIIITGTSKGTVLWDRLTGQLLQQIKSGMVEQAIFNENGVKMAMIHLDKGVSIWKPSLTWDIDTLTIEQMLLVYLLDNYYPKLMDYNPAQRVKILKLIAHLKKVDYNYVLSVFNSFSAEQQKILRETYMKPADSFLKAKIKSVWKSVIDNLSE